MQNTIKVERAKMELTQADLAEKVGVSRQTINSIEKGRFVPSTLLALKIAHVFGAKVDHIFSLEPEDWDEG
ncbi:helix-turn-helix transcriptional regulator [Flavilitoribacter nigricans]|uniref:Transcriptional regulator n=1 Tax=Flavilitoribacter nigricans (strain ATCC 23147 / DSM 23189 / NBRC 102662 / NCIMB 1420 / SS-2) TaxID=1122177 RepID=A0A2D0NI61_FLAN2|nr:helix-turn-helix transcriptional regulator [Flavilitoribacter nigricans]PHN08202.1 transcriptional regulator [Flavilitoribacter nigricans DSM 23189 = NBRC 102662]